MYQLSTIYFTYLSHDLFNIITNLYFQDGIDKIGDGIDKTIKKASIS